MQRELYPYEQVEDSLERHLSEHSRRSRAIYLAILAAVLAGLALLPVVRVGVSVQGSGIVRPSTEKHEVRAQASGFVEALGAREGERVERGEVLLTLRTAQLRERAGLLDAQIEQNRGFVHDLELLSRAAPGEALAERLRTDRYRQEHVQLRNELGEIELRVEQARREAERARELARRSLAPQAEAEEREFQLSQLRSEAALRAERYRSGWQSALATARMQLEEQLSRRGEAREEEAMYRIVAPVTGTVEEVASISTGSFVQGGAPFAVISPLSELVAEVYVTPRDIGLVRVGNPVRVLVDAFNYNDWGFLTGRVTEISDDYLDMDGHPVFRVGVALDRTELRLKNGFRGRLKKGMTLRARFMVTERTLFQLLRDDVNDWLNPIQGG